MSLNIKNAEVEDLARRVAAVTGTSITAAVAQALREKLARLQVDSPVDTAAHRAARIRAVAKEIAPRFRGDVATVEHGDLLYDDAGMPA
ncbi:type II toxin-antitoxin system VapB family antitoxin [Blastococcus saxobsidens]|uniref:Putative transcription factor n=1 Tax=Blastococcus saxobsidens (strain DD2) TaxID=1146883 RepID=H6RSW2_BLASD|nr:type II toxin-antitoxin system VapB family antitoxin [Blastococcus saxobsidens]CCG03065.1 putative transcription factor [Blastococcus saxobsidens DD2]